jgi:hypothetical protein
MTRVGFQQHEYHVRRQDCVAGTHEPPSEHWIANQPQDGHRQTPQEWHAAQPEEWERRFPDLFTQEACLSRQLPNARRTENNSMSAISVLYSTPERAIAGRDSSNETSTRLEHVECLSKQIDQLIVITVFENIKRHNKILRTSTHHVSKGYVC